MTSKGRKDGRLRGIMITLVTVIALGWLIAELPLEDEDGPAATATTSLGRPIEPRPLAEQSTLEAGVENSGQAVAAPSALRQQLNQRFQQAVWMLHAQRYEHALIALDAVLSIDPNLPEAYINAGFALLGLKRYQEADLAFSQAIELRPQLSNAYYGLAVALEGRGQARAAEGAMQIYLHRADPSDLFYRKAQSAIWEWQEQRQKAKANAAEESPAEKATDPAAEQATG